MLTSLYLLKLSSDVVVRSPTLSRPTSIDHFETMTSKHRLTYNVVIRFSFQKTRYFKSPMEHSTKKTKYAEVLMRDLLRKKSKHRKTTPSTLLHSSLQSY